MPCIFKCFRFLKYGHLNFYRRLEIEDSSITRHPPSNEMKMVASLLHIISGVFGF